MLAALGLPHPQIKRLTEPSDYKDAAESATILYCRLRGCNSYSGVIRSNLDCPGIWCFKEVPTRAATRTRHNQYGERNHELIMANHSG